MTDIIIIGIIIIIVAIALRSSVKHFKGEGSCCGGGSGSIREKKKLTEPIIGKMTVHVEGMHCENCRNSVEKSINNIEGAAAVVHLKRKIAQVSMSREIPAEEIKKAVEAAGFQVTGIEEKKF